MCAQASEIRSPIPDTLSAAHRCSAFGIPPLNHNQWASPTHASPKAMGSFFIYRRTSKISPTVSPYCTRFVKKRHFVACRGIYPLAPQRVQRLTKVRLMSNRPAYLFGALITLFKIHLAALNKEKKDNFSAKINQ